MKRDRSSHDGDARGFDETQRFSIDNPSPWYLRRWVLALWGVAVVVLITIIVYGLTILARDNGRAPAPTTSRTSTTTPSTTSLTTPSTTMPTTTTTDGTVEPAPSSTTSLPPHHRHRWHGNLPPVPPLPHF